MGGMGEQPEGVWLFEEQEAPDWREGAHKTVFSESVSEQVSDTVGINSACSTKKKNERKSIKIKFNKI